MDSTIDTYRRPYRWVVLAAYTLVAGASQMLWLNFAPLLTLIQRRYAVGELTASTLVLVFPLQYVVLSLPAGAMTDRRGYRFTVSLGPVVMAVCSCLRIYDASFWALLAGQAGIAVAQPFVLNGISKLVSSWFSTEQGAIATGLGTAGMFIGMAVGMAASPALVQAMGLGGAMVVFSGITVVLTLAFLVLVRENRGPVPGTRDPAAPTGGFRMLLGNRDLLLVFALSFVGLGFFNGLTTWLEGILAPNGINAVDAGMVGGLLIVGGTRASSCRTSAGRQQWSRSPMRPTHRRPACCGGSTCGRCDTPYQRRAPASRTSDPAGPDR